MDFIILLLLLEVARKTQAISERDYRTAWNVIGGTVLILVLALIAWLVIYIAS